MLRTHCFNKVSAARTSKPVYRSLSTQINHTKLNNGLSIYTAPSPSNVNKTTVLIQNAGPSAENQYNNGVAHFWSHYFELDPILNKWANSKGAILSSSLQKDYQTFAITSSPTSLSLQESLNFIQSHIFSGGEEGKNSSILDNAIPQLKQQMMDKVTHQEICTPEKATIEHLYSTAFQNTPLSLPRLGTLETIQDLTKFDLQKFVSDTFNVSDNISILVSGPQASSHDSVVETINKNFIPSSSTSKSSNNTTTEKSTFLGSEVRLRDDTLPHAWISIAVESEPIGSPHQLTAQVASYVFGSYNASEPKSRLQGIKLLDNLQEYQLCDNFKHFQLSHKDSGLWGMITQTSNIGAIDDLIHFILKQWNRLSISITSTELNRAKAMLKLSLAQKFANEEDWPDLIVNYKTTPLEELYKQIDQITVKDIKVWANKRLWDQDIAIAGMGQIEGLLDYMRIRNDMSMMRW